MWSSWQKQFFCGHYMASFDLFCLAASKSSEDWSQLGFFFFFLHLAAMFVVLHSTAELPNLCFHRIKIWDCFSLLLSIPAFAPLLWLWHLNSLYTKKAVKCADPRDRKVKRLLRKLLQRQRTKAHRTMWLQPYDNLPVMTEVGDNLPYWATYDDTLAGQLITRWLRRFQKECF